MPGEGYRQVVLRMARSHVDLDVPAGTSPQQATIGALQLTLVHGDEMPWELLPLTPKTIKPYGAPQRIPASTLTGQQALTTEPDYQDDGPPIPEDGLQLSEEEAAQIAGGIEGASPEESEEDDEGGGDLADVAEDVVAYLDLEDEFERRRFAGETITAEEYQHAHEMRENLRAAFSGGEDDDELPVEEVL